MILTFASSKGGVGKSTTCAAVAAGLAAEGARVLAIDLDPNRTLSRWAKKSEAPGLTVTSVEPADFSAYSRQEETSGRYDHILIDLAGTREVTLFKALARADLVIIPAQASEPDMREALVIAEDVRDVAESTGRAIPFRILFTKLYPLRTRVTEFAFAELARHRLPRFETALVERAAYREMFLNGVAPTASEPGRGAGAEVKALIAEIRAIADAKPRLKKGAA